MTNILNECSFISPVGIELIGEHYNASYVFESCIKGLNGQWTNYPTAIFYTEIPHPKGSNYFAVYQNTEGEFRITNGISATEEFISAIQIDDDIIYSRYCHDFREHHGVFVDGGRDYLRVGGAGARFDDIKHIVLIVDKDRLVVMKP